MYFFLKSTSIIFLFVILLCCCINKKTDTKPTPTFESFEISYSSGWAKDFSLYVDSNRIYFLEGNKDTIYYGILPESIFEVIDSLSTKVKDDTKKLSK